jgi:hypothetical protein
VVTHISSSIPLGCFSDSITGIIAEVSTQTGVTSQKPIRTLAITMIYSNVVFNLFSCSLDAGSTEKPSALTRTPNIHVVYEFIGQHISDFRNAICRDACRSLSLNALSSVYISHPAFDDPLAWKAAFKGSPITNIKIDTVGASGLIRGLSGVLEPESRQTGMSIVKIGPPSRRRCAAGINIGPPRKKHHNKRPDEKITTESPFLSQLKSLTFRKVNFETTVYDLSVPAIVAHGLKRRGSPLHLLRLSDCRPAFAEHHDDFMGAVGVLDWIKG